MRYIVGGIGDIIISIQGAIEDGECNLYSHFEGARDFVESFGVEVNTFVLFKPFEHICMSGTRMTETPWPEFDIPDGPLIQSNKPILGIHPFGSEFSNAYYTANSQQLKSSFFNIDNLKYLVNSLKQEYKIILFGSNKELDNLPKIESTTKIYTSIKEITKIVSQCSAVIGADSAIKTIASVLHIPTYVYMGVYENKDHKFIKPYRDAGEMITYISNNTHKTIFDQTIELLVK